MALLDYVAGPITKYLDVVTGGWISAGIAIGGKPPGSSHPGGIKTILDKPQASDKVDIAISTVQKRRENYELAHQPYIPDLKPDYIPTDYGEGGGVMPFNYNVLPFVGGTTPGYGGIGLPGVGSQSSAGVPWWQTLLTDVVGAGIGYLTQPKSSPPPSALPPGAGTIMGVPYYDAYANVQQNLVPYFTPNAGTASGVPSGYHLDKKTRSHLVKNRHTNYANGRAAMRAIRRLRGTRKMLAKIERMMPHRKSAPRPRRRR